MRNLVLVPILAALLGAGAGALSGCSETTNCKKMKQKMDKCEEKLWLALEPRLGRRAPSSWRLNKNAHHFRYCKKVKGRYKQAAAINKCLAKKSCADFANCFCRAVKKGCGKVK